MSPSTRRRIRCSLYVTGAALTAMIVLQSNALAANRGLDASFDGDGMLTTSFPALSKATSVVVQPDGKIVAAGYTFQGEADFALARYLSSGSLDPTFGQGGLVTTDLGAAEFSYGLALQPDGRLVVAGYTSDAGEDDLALARYTPAGALDPTFGQGGIVLTDGGQPFERAHDVALQVDGKLVVAAGSFLARYQTDGTLDPSFDDDGFAPSGVFAYSVALQPDGKVVVAGPTTGSNTDLGVSRYLPTGAADATFGSGGTQSVDAGGQDIARAVEVQPDGKIVVGGHTSTDCQLDACDGDLVVARLLSDGTLDRSFGRVGVARSDHSTLDEQLQELAIQPDGRIVAVSAELIHGTHANTPNGFAVTRFTKKGKLDRSFSHGGVVTAFSGQAGGWAIAIQPDGKLVAAGNVQSCDGFSFCDYSNFALARILPGPGRPL